MKINLILTRLEVYPKILRLSKNQFNRKEKKFLPLQARVFLKANDQRVNAGYASQLPDQTLESRGREPEEDGAERAQAHMAGALKDGEDMARVYDETSRGCVHVERVFRLEGERIGQEEGREYKARPANVYRQ